MNLLRSGILVVSVAVLIVSHSQAADRPNIVIETIKRAEDGNGFIVRLYESQRRRGEITLTTGFPLAEVYHTNLLEEAQTSLTPHANQVTLFVKPHEPVLQYPQYMDIHSFSPAPSLASVDKQFCLLRERPGGA